MVKFALNFGIRLFILNILKYLGLSFLNEKRHKLIMSILKKKYNHLLLKYKDIDLSLCDSSIPKNIWICWWGGIDNMPPIVRACYNSVLKHSSGCKVNLITKDNYSEYVAIPEYILEKAKSKKITVTHLSDIIRMYLIKEHGGFWLDATVLATDNISIDNKFFFTIRREYGGDYVSKRRWAGNCIAGSKNNPLFNFLCEIFNEYWKTNNALIDYFLIDYSIALAYDNIPAFKEMINSTEMNNTNYLAFNMNLYKEYSPDFYEAITKNTMFHKLFWRVSKRKLLRANKKSLYDYIIGKFYYI